MRTKKILPRLLLFLFLGAFVFVSFQELKGYFFQSSFFEVKDFHLELVGPVEVEERKSIEAKIEEFLGSFKGTSIFLLDIHFIRKELLDFPELKTVELGRVLPDSLNLRVELESPLAIIQGQNLSLINSKGEIYRELKKGERISIPIIAIEGGAAWEDLSENRIKGVLDLIAELKNSSVLDVENVEEIFLRGPNYSGLRPMELTMHLSSGKVTRSVRFNGLTLVQWKESNLVKQTRRLELLIKTLLEQKKIPSLVRMGLGKKIIVKVAQ